MVYEKKIQIESADYWVKVIEMLQQNWALVDFEKSKRAHVFFINDLSCVFDEMTFPSVAEANTALKQNGFRRYSEDSEMQSFLTPPPAPFHIGSHPNGKIYSSGRFWVS